MLWQRIVLKLLSYTTTNNFNILLTQKILKMIYQGLVKGTNKSQYNFNYPNESLYTKCRTINPPKMVILPFISGQKCISDIVVSLKALPYWQRTWICRKSVGTSTLWTTLHDLCTSWSVSCNLFPWGLQDETGLLYTVQFFLVNEKSEVEAFIMRFHDKHVPMIHPYFMSRYAYQRDKLNYIFPWYRWLAWNILYAWARQVWILLHGMVCLQSGPTILLFCMTHPVCMMQTIC